ncbi:hypothetical protein MJT46_009029 [Ovis ammon polii x Ovis aries]|nr:hypothetical protein MJT46_009029 [Ovis ammon polii x Ovis aries]
MGSGLEASPLPGRASASAAPTGDGRRAYEAPTVCHLPLSVACGFLRTCGQAVLLSFLQGRFPDLSRSSEGPTPREDRASLFCLLAQGEGNTGRRTSVSKGKDGGCWTQRVSSLGRKAAATAGRPWGRRTNVPCLDSPRHCVFTQCGKSCSYPILKMGACMKLVGHVPRIGPQDVMCRKRSLLNGPSVPEDSALGPLELTKQLHLLFLCSLSLVIELCHRDLRGPSRARES